MGDQNEDRPATAKISSVNFQSGSEMELARIASILRAAEYIEKNNTPEGMVAAERPSTKSSSVTVATTSSMMRTETEPHQSVSPQL
jgi:hypothetical protein